MNKINKLLLVIGFLLCFNFAIGQQGDTVEIQRNQNGRVSFMLLKPNYNRKKQNAVTFLKTVLKARAEDEFRLTKESIDNIGMTHSRYQQYFRGIKVEGSEYLIHSKKGIIESINGDFKEVNIGTIKPLIIEFDALQKALSKVGAKKYKWEDSAMQRWVKQNTNNPNATYYPKGELVISKDFLGIKNDYKLSWKFTISSLEPDNEQLVYINATSGALMNIKSLAFDANILGMADTRYTGTQFITGDTYSGGVRLRENRNGVDVQTLNAQNTTNYASAIDFSNNSANWLCILGSPWNCFQNKQALDAHWGTEKVLDYWSSVFGRNSIDGNGIRVLGYVHAGVNYNNARWVAGSNNHYMTYGDGDGTTFGPFTALDIIAHEFGHGICEFTCNVNQGTDGHQEADALDEGLSDIWGACIEHWAAPGKQTWIMGEEVVSNGVRNLQNPNSSLPRDGSCPATYHGQFWDNGGEAHTNSTVLSHWFYLLVQGGTGVNDLNNTFNVGAIGFSDAQQIVYRAESNYLAVGSGYNDARTATIQAARDLFGLNSCQEASVKNAWFAVGIGTDAGISIAGDNLFCQTSNNYSITNLPSGSTVQWTIYPINVATINSPNNQQTTLTASSTGSVMLTATITLTCGYTITLTKPDIKIGAPNAVLIQNLNNLNVCDDENTTFQILPSSGVGYAYQGTLTVISDYGLATNYSWVQITGPAANFAWSVNGPILTVSAKANGTSFLSLKCTASNSCGGTAVKYFYFSTGCSVVAARTAKRDNKINDLSPADLLLPNPTKGAVQIHLASGIKEAVVTSMNGVEITRIKFKGFNQTENINIQNLAAGVYIIQIFDGEKWINRRVIKQ